MIKQLLAIFISITVALSPAYAGGEGASKAIGAATTGLSTILMVKAMGNMAGAKTMKAGCAGSQVWMCALMVLTLAQVVIDLTSKDSSGATKAAITSTGNFGVGGSSDNYDSYAGGSGGSSGYGGLGEDGGYVGNGSGYGELGGPGAPGGPDEIGKLLAQANKNLAELKAKGYSFDPATDTVTTPKGKFPSSAFASGQAMADAGYLDKGLAGQVDAELKAMQSQYKVVAMGMAGGGGGGGAGGGYGGSTKYVEEDLYGKKPMGFGDEQPKDPRTAGLTRTIASGESIGASVDDIFKMITRRYQAKSAEKIFVGQETKP